MTVQIVPRRINYTANGVQSQFVFNFRVDNTAWIFVLEDDVATANPFTVTLNADQDTNPGGTVDFTSTVPADTVIVTIYSSILENQLTDYGAYDSFPEVSHELALDKLTMLIQEILDSITRSVTISPSDDGTLDLTLPPYIAGYLLGYSDDPPESIVTKPVSEVYAHTHDKLYSGANIRIISNTSGMTQYGANAASSPPVEADPLINNIVLRDLGGAEILAQLGFLSTSDLTIQNDVHGGRVVIITNDSGGNPVVSLILDPDNPTPQIVAAGNVNGTTGLIQYGLNAVTARVSLGNYTVTFSSPLASANYVVNVTSSGAALGAKVTNSIRTVNGFSVDILDGFGALMDGDFDFQVSELY